MGHSFGFCFLFYFFGFHHFPFVSLFLCFFFLLERKLCFDASAFRTLHGSTRSTIDRSLWQINAIVDWATMERIKDQLAIAGRVREFGSLLPLGLFVTGFIARLNIDNKPNADRSACINTSVSVYRIHSFIHSFIGRGRFEFHVRFSIRAAVKTEKSRHYGEE